MAIPEGEVHFQSFVRTRSAAVDYHWFGGGGTEPDEWWAEGWGKPPLWKHDRCLLREEGPSGRVLLTGILSGRRDSSSSRTPISYDLAFEECADLSAECELQTTLELEHVRAIVWAWWQQRNIERHSPWPLGEWLDEELDREAGQSELTLDDLPSRMVDDARQAEVERVTLRALVRVGRRCLARSRVDSGQVPQDLVDVLWVGSGYRSTGQLVASESAIAYFDLLDQEAMKEVRSPKDLERVLGVATGRVVVVDDHDLAHWPSRDSADLPDRDESADGKRSPDPKVSPPARGDRSHTMMAVVALMLLVLIVGALVIAT